MNRYQSSLLFLGFILIAGLPLGAQSWFSPQQIKHHIAVLAADSLEGRATGSKGEEMAASYIIQQFVAAGLSPAGDQGTWLQSFNFEAGIHGADGRKGKANNIIGYLDNKAPLTVIIGAHYDHLGDGSDGHSLEPHLSGEVHNGADDNASGVAGLIELARYYGNNRETERFNFLFIAFSGEELGLLGSDWFVNNPLTDLSKVNCMINMDMIGRLDPARPVLTVSGSGTAPEWEAGLHFFSSAIMKIKTDSAGLGPSDHASFYKKGIPALHFFTGSHADYHKPSDDVEKINIRGVEAVLLVIVGLIENLPEHKLSFLKTRISDQGTQTTFKVTLGIMPSYAPTDQGLKAEAIHDGKPASKAGMKDGDVIIQIGDYPVKEIQTYMEALGKFEKGQKTMVKIMRKGEILILPIEF